MKPRNTTFAQVIQAKSRSPQPLTKASNISLAEIFDQWEQYPDQDYTLYLGQFSHSFKSRHSSIRMGTSKNQQIDNEQMFDSWIQRQSTLNANKGKENYSAQPQSQSRKLMNNQRPNQPSFGIKIREAEQKSKKTVNFVNNNENRRKETPKPVINFKQLENIGGHIKMIKSNTCQNENMDQVRSPQKHQNVQNINLDVSEHSYKQYGQQSEQQEENSYNREDTEEATENHYQGIKTVKSERNFDYKQQINNIIEHTNNHLKQQITDLAHNYVDRNKEEYEEPEEQDDKQENSNEPENRLLQSQTSQRTQSIQEEEDQLLIGNSDKKPFGNYQKQDNFFSQEYLAKKRQNEERERKRIEQAKMQIKSLANDIMKKSNKPREPVIFNIQKEEPKVLEGNIDVGYSFASNVFENSSKGVQFDRNQPNIVKTQEPSKYVPEQIYNEDEDNFRKKYVKDDDQNKNKSINNSLKDDNFTTQRISNTSILNQMNQEDKPSTESTVCQTVVIKVSQQTQYQHFKFTYDQPTSVKMQEIKFKEPQQKIYSRQIKVDPVVGYQTNASKDHDRAPNQKLKIYSSNKSKKNSSNKSSPSGPSSQEKSEHQQNADVKTNPFTATLQNNSNMKIGIERVEIKDKENKTTPFQTIKEVKEDNNKKPDNNTSLYGNKTSEYYATSKPIEPYKNSSTLATYDTKAPFAYPSYATTGLPSYQTTGYVNSYTPSNFSTSKYEYETLKTEEIKQGKTYESIIQENQPTYGTKKDNFSDRKSYLAGLDLKQSINVDEPNRLKFEDMKHKEQLKIKEEKSLLDRQLKQSLKESVNLQASGQFDFNF